MLARPVVASGAEGFIACSITDLAVTAKGFCSLGTTIGCT